MRFPALKPRKESFGLLAERLRIENPQLVFFRESFDFDDGFTHFSYLLLFTSHSLPRGARSVSWERR
jgi:hypothetical protein